jgi:hypothetical protein
MDLIEVTSRVNQEGKPIPSSFAWEGVSYRVDGVGRRWEEKGGEHILVMVQPNNQVFELLYESDGDIWRMVKKHGRPNHQKA